MKSSPNREDKRVMMMMGNDAGLNGQTAVVVVIVIVIVITRPSGDLSNEEWSMTGGMEGGSTEV